MLPFPLIDTAGRDLRMAAANRRFQAAKNLVGYEASRSMSPPRLQLSDGGDYVVVEWRRREPEEGRGDGGGLEAPMPSPPTEPGEGGGDCDRGEAPMPSPPTEPEAANDGSGAEGGDGDTIAGSGEGGDEELEEGGCDDGGSEGGTTAHATGEDDGEVTGEADGIESGVPAAPPEQLWAPKYTDELFNAIATMDYGVSNDRSSTLATPGVKAYNKVASQYEQALQKRGKPLHEGFTIVKVRCIHLLHPYPHSHGLTFSRSGARRLPVSLLGWLVTSTSSTRLRACSSPRRGVWRHVSRSHTIV